jgi:hypothetical protein
VTEVRIYYNLRTGSPRVWDFFGDLGELIRKLTDEPTEQAVLEAGAVRETEDERWGSLRSALARRGAGDGPERSGGVTYDEAMAVIHRNGKRTVVRADMEIGWRFGRPVVLGKGARFIDYTPTRDDMYASDWHERVDTGAAAGA